MTHIEIGATVEILDNERDPSRYPKAVVVPQPEHAVAPNDHEQFHWVRYDNDCVVPVRDWYVRVVR